MDWVIIYTIVIMFVRALAISYLLGSSSEYKSIDNANRAANVFMGTVGILPLVGRVFNWW